MPLINRRMANHIPPSFHPDHRSCGGPADIARRTLLMSLTWLATGCSPLARAPETSVPAWTRQSKLRVAINHGNAVLARKDPQSGELSGVSVDIGRELGRQLNLPVELIAFDAANKSVDAVRSGQADLGFFAIDPLRSEGLQFTAPYVVIEGAYVVPSSSAIQSLEAVDRAGVRVAVAAKSAYDLYLSRSIRQATLVKTVRSDQVVDMMLSQQLEVAAGVKQQLERDMQRVSGLRMLQPSFMQIQQAMATADGHPQGARYLRRFVEQLKASGFVHQALARHRIEGVTVPPASPA